MKKIIITSNFSTQFNAITIHNELRTGIKKVKALIRSEYLAELVMILGFVILSVNLSKSQQMCAFDGTGSIDKSYYDISSFVPSGNHILKVYFNIVRNSAGQTNYSPDRIPNLITVINGAFNPYGINFKYDCSDNFINNSTLYYSGSEDQNWCLWNSVPKHQDGIDIFIISGGIGSFRGRVNGIPGNFLVLAGRNDANSYIDIESNTVVHELGHILGLLHMYHGATQNPNIWPDLFGNGGILNTQQLACGFQYRYPWSEYYYNCSTGSYFPLDNYECVESYQNGSSAGDYISDTPQSHYYAEKKVGNNCDYIVEPIYNDPQGKPLAPIILTPEGNNYEPDVTNFISIFPDVQCRDHFSNNQVIVMKKFIQNHPLLQPLRVQNPETSCLCIYGSIINVNGNKNWSSIISQFNLNPSILSGKQIIVNGTLTFDVSYQFEYVNFLMKGFSTLILKQSNNVTLNYSHVYSCSGFWNTFNVERGATLTSDHSSFDYALYAISSEKGATLNINNTIFNNNNYGIFMKSTGTGMNTFTKLNSNTFKSDATFSITIDNASYNRPAAGIIINDQNSVNLISNIGKENTFIRLFNGIVAIRSTVMVQYSNFSDIKKSLGSGFTNEMLTSEKGYGILIKDGTGVSILKYNEFSDTYYPIAQSKGMLVARNNTINDSQYGIIGYHLNSVKILDNNITSNSKGILINESTAAPALNTIHSNYVTLPVNNIGGGNHNAIGIDIESTDKLNLYNNSVWTGANYAGLQLQNAMNTIMDNNSVFVDGAYNNTETAAFHLKNADNGSFTDNLAENLNSGDHNNQGFYITQSPFSSYQCNSTSRFNLGMHFFTNTDFSPLKGNQYHYNVKDLVLGDDYEIGITGGATAIGPQGDWNSTPEIGWGNKWPAGAGVAHNSGTIVWIDYSLFTVKEDNFHPQGFIPRTIEAVSDWFFNTASSNLSPCTGTPGSDLPPLCSQLITRIQQLDTMRTMSQCYRQMFLYKYYTQLLTLKKKGLLSDECLRFLSSRQNNVLYQLAQVKLSIDTITKLHSATIVQLSQLYSSTLVLDSLYSAGQYGTSNWLTAVADYQNVLTNYNTAIENEKIRDRAMSDSTRTALTRISVLDSCIRTVLRVYDIRLRLLTGDTLTNIDITYLRSVAALCPDEYAEGVYQARSMLSIYDDDTRYQDAYQCFDKGIRMRGEENEILTEKLFSVYPNPTLDETLFNYYLDSEEAGKIMIFNIEGLKIAEYNLGKNSKSLKLLTENWKEGIYIIRFTTSLGREYIEKLVKLK